MTRAAAAVPHVDSARTEAQNVSVAGAARIERPRPVFTVRANEGEVSIPESAGGGKEDCIAVALTCYLTSINAV